MNPATVLSLDQLRAKRFPAQEWVVEDLIPRGGLTGIFGREKIGKSLLISHMGMAVAMDQPFLDRAVTAGPVMFLPVEEHLREVQGRLVALAGSQSPPAFVFPVGGEYEQDVRLDNLVSWGRVEEAILANEISSAFFDPLREMHGGAENDSDEMAPILRTARNFAHDTNTAIVVVHHASKAGGARGSSAITAAFDQIVELTSMNEEEDLTSTRLRVSVRGRYGPPKLLYAKLGDGFRWQLVDSPVEQEASSTRQRILELIVAAPDPLTAKQLADAAQIKLKTCQNLISELLNQPSPAIVAIGSGKAGDARRYQPVNQRLFADESIPDSRSPIENGNREYHSRTIPDIPGTPGNTDHHRACTTCGGQLETGRTDECSICSRRRIEALRKANPGAWVTAP